jgi:transcriptional regulator with XRE-family HTH domain
MERIKPQVEIHFNPKLLPMYRLNLENQPMNKIGLKIKAAIEAKGITQMALAEIIGVSNNAVTKWIKTGQIGKENIPKIAEALNLSIADFFDAPEGDLVHALYLLKDPKLRALLFASENLSEYKKDILVQTSTALAEQPSEGTNGNK